MFSRKVLIQLQFNLHRCVITRRSVRAKYLIQYKFALVTHECDCYLHCQSGLRAGKHTRLHTDTLTEVSIKMLLCSLSAAGIFPVVVCRLPRALDTVRCVTCPLHHNVDMQYALYVTRKEPRCNPNPNPNPNPTPNLNPVHGELCAVIPPYP